MAGRQPAGRGPGPASGRDRRRVDRRPDHGRRSCRRRPRSPSVSAAGSIRPGCPTSSSASSRCRRRRSTDRPTRPRVPSPRLAEASTLKVSAATCGLTSVGTGFVVAQGYVVTNAHVVAGRRRPRRAGPAARARSSTRSPSCSTRTSTSRCSTSTACGAGRSLRPARPRARRARCDARLPRRRVADDPAGRGRRPLPRDGARHLRRRAVRREILELRAEIERGDSGGPLVLTDGTVGGVVFAEARTDPEVGYALAATEVAAASRSRIGRRRPRHGGACTSRGITGAPRWPGRVRRARRHGPADGQRILAAGFPLTVTSRSAAPLPSWSRRAQTQAPRRPQVASRADVVIVMVPDAARLEAVLDWAGRHPGGRSSRARGRGDGNASPSRDATARRTLRRRGRALPRCAGVRRRGRRDRRQPSRSWSAATQPPLSGRGRSSRRWAGRSSGRRVGAGPAREGMQSAHRRCDDRGRRGGADAGPRRGGRSRGRPDSTDRRIRH